MKQRAKTLILAIVFLTLSILLVIKASSDTYTSTYRIEEYKNNTYNASFGEFNEFVERNNAINQDEIAEYVVRSDGAANTLARYDGEENTFEFDGTTYYIYKA
jgi:hypothetical protein